MEKYKKEFNNLSLEVLVDGETLFTRVDEYISIIPWKMNLLACSKTKPYLFLGVNNNIYAYKIYNEKQYSEEPFIILKTGNNHEISINSIKMDYLYDEEILVAVCDNGLITIFFMSDLEHEPIKLKNDNDISTWGIAIYGPLGYIAVSANNFLIKMYKILKNSNKSIINEISKSQENNKLNENQEMKIENDNNDNNNIDLNNNDGNDSNDNNNIDLNNNDGNDNNNDIPVTTITTNNNNDNNDDDNNNNDDININNENNQNEIFPNESEINDSIDFENYYTNERNSGKQIENNSKYLLGKECIYFKGHKHNIPCISFSKDGKYLISNSIDSTVKIWNVNTGKKVYSKIVEKNGWNWAGKFIEINHGYVYKKEVIDKYLESVQVHDDIMDRFMALRRFFPNIPGNIRNLINRGEILLNSVSINQVLEAEEIEQQNENAMDDTAMDDNVDIIESGSEISFRYNSDEENNIDSEILEDEEENSDIENIVDSEIDEEGESENILSNLSNYSIRSYDDKELSIVKKEKLNKKRSYNSMQYDKTSDSGSDENENDIKLNSGDVSSYDLMGKQKLISQSINNSKKIISMKEEEKVNDSDHNNMDDGNKGKKKKSEDKASCSHDNGNNNNTDNQNDNSDIINNNNNNNNNNCNLHELSIINNPEYHEINIESTHPNVSNQTHLIHEVEIEEATNNIQSEREEINHLFSEVVNNIFFDRPSENSEVDSVNRNVVSNGSEPDEIYNIEFGSLNEQDDDLNSSDDSSDSTHFESAIDMDEENDGDDEFMNTDENENNLNIDDDEIFRDSNDNEEFHSDAHDNEEFHSDAHDEEFHSDAHDSEEFHSDVHDSEEFHSDVHDSEEFHSDANDSEEFHSDVHDTEESHSDINDNNNVSSIIGTDVANGNNEQPNNGDDVAFREEGDDENNEIDIVFEPLIEISDSDEDFPVIEEFNESDDDLSSTSSDSDDLNLDHLDTDDKELTININNQTFILVSTIYNIFLLDKTGKIIDILENPFEPYCKSLNRYSRISILEWIPDMDVGVVGSQKGVFGLLRIIKLKEEQSYKMIIESYLPKKLPLYPIAGLCIKPFSSTVDPLLSYFLIYITFLNGSFYIYKLKYNLNSFPLSLTTL